MEIVFNALLIAAGLAALCYGGSWLVRGGVSIAKHLGMSPFVIGMTIVAYGTSTPELAASLAAGSEHSAIILGNVVGSNIANIGMVIGITAIIAPILIGARTLRKEIPIMIGFSILLVALSLDAEISNTDGIILIAALVAFSVYICISSRRSRDTEDVPEGTDSVLKSIAIIAVGMVALYAGAIVTLDNAVSLSLELGLSERIIGITVVAIGTSLPELITSIIAIRKGHASIGVGNIIGSNIYNVLMIVGISSAIFGIAVEPEMFSDYAVMIIFSVSLFVALRTKYIKKPVGIILVCAYAIYLATLALR